MYEERLIDSLKPHPVNERIYGDLFDHELIKSIEDYGFKGAIEITKDDVIISGHRRYNACQELGYETIPVTVLDIEAPDELINYLIRMNQSQRKRTNEQIAVEFEVLKEIAERDSIKRISANGGDKKSVYSETTGVENFPHPIIATNIPMETKPADTGKTRDIAAAKTNSGWSGKTAENALKVKTYADDIRDEDPETADILINLLNNKSVNAAFIELKKIKKAVAQANVAQKKADEAKKQEEEMADVIATPDPEPPINKQDHIPVPETTSITEPEKKEDPKEFFNPEPQKPVIQAIPIKKSKFNKTNDNIEWAKWSWNPVTGCLHDCQYCYARDIAVRYNKGDFSPAFHEGRLNAPQFTNIPQDRIDEPGINNVFVCSMADLFGKWVDPEWIQTIIDICREQSQWTYLMLTKNPERYLEFEFPENCWLGASATNQVQFNRAIDAFCQIRHPVKFLSCEPLNERISVRTTTIYDDYPEDDANRFLAMENFDKEHKASPEYKKEFALTVSNELEAIDWIIIGGRSESMRMPAFQPEWMWVQHLMASADAAGVPIYFKPNLTVRPRSYPKRN